jgi:hypothetical protein
MATHGENRRPPPGKINGRLRGESHGRRQWVGFAEALRWIWLRMVRASYRRGQGALKFTFTVSGFVTSPPSANVSSARTGKPPLGQVWGTRP